MTDLASEQASEEVGDLLDRCRTTLDKCVAAIDACCERVIAMLERPGTVKGAKKYNDKLASHLAWLTIRVAEITTSLRQLEKHDRAMSKTPEQRHKLVAAYIRQLDPVRRAELAALIGQLEQERNVLQ